MPNVLVGSQAPGKSLPAELVVGGKDGHRRLMQNGATVQQRGRAWAVDQGQGRKVGLMRITGIGDVMCPDGSTQPDLTSCLNAGDWGSTIDVNTGGGQVPVVVAPTSPSFNWAGLTNVINASSTDIAKILAASNPGTLYRDPQGNVIYSQPAGNQQNLLVGAGGSPGAQGTFSTPLGSGTFGGINTSTLLLVAVVGMMFMMMGGRR